MLGSIATYLTKSRVRKHNLAAKRNFLAWNKIEKIALIIDSNLNINKSEIDRFIEGTKKYTGVFFIEPASKQATYNDWKCFTKAHRNFLNLPNSSCTGELNTQSFDVAIVLSEQNKLYSAYLASHIVSAFKCGNNNLFGELDIIIEKKDSQNPTAYLNEIRKYLEMIRTE